MASLEAIEVKGQRTFFRIAYMWHGKKEHFKVGITSKKIALQRKTQIEALLIGGKNPKDEIEKVSVSKCRVSDLMERDLAWAEGRRQPHTLRINRWAMEQFRDWANDPLVSEVNRPLLERFMTYLHGELNRSETTVNMIVRQLKATFQRAVEEHNLLADHPFRSLKLLTQPKASRKPNYLTVEQVGILLDGIGNEHFKRLVRFYLLTGCRRTEALELRWDDIDWQHKVLYLGQARSKTKIRRSFPIGERLGLLLGELTEDKGKSDLVFWRFSKVVSNISNMLKRIRETTEGLPDTFTTHSLRHTFASHLVMAGVDIMTVATLLGHTTSKTTELYAHLLPQHKTVSVEKLPY